ncbi:uncharacterized protein PV09_08176 [Verruconis gallopava]|uniref:Uncharacterized protein n=1 Tax=Verruconis gallopava TaxID=253628 RepID=A0A0D1XDH5_9PEZI|nr:uncharacterized protein PV09_08176 [Verruconis gallopava]KIW00286.1 hypothetical protein PV09_08176 [Verruconis gallopava]
MTYQSSFAANSGLGLPGAGYASRGKANGLKRLNLASPPKLGSLSENGVDENPPPRTSRSYLLAGLRTAPKTPSVPSSAPYNQTQHAMGNPMDQSRYAHHGGVNAPYNANQAVPHTAIGSSFPTQYGQAGQQYYSLPEQVLAPPNLDFVEDEDPQMLAQLQATKSMLALRQQLLQQQLASLTAQQFAMMNLGQTGQMYNSPQTPSTPHLGLYNHQQLMQPVVTEVPGQPGIYTVYNPLTGQTTLAADTSRQQEASQLANSPPPPTPHSVAGSFNRADTPGSRRQMSSPQNEIQSPFGQQTRSMSPPKKTPSPPAAGDVEPLPPPSANAFRRGHHKKVSSLSLTNNASVADGPKSAFIPRSHNVPPTPLTGTFGPGQARAGEHPLRQPRGPPAMEELKAKPTAAFEGSLNFAARRRRQALSNLMRAGLERHRVQRPGSGSNGSMTPVSESELSFSVPSSGSDNDSDSGRSVHGAIGSERKASRESLAEAGASAAEQRRPKAPLLALANAAEKRRSIVY